MESFFGPKSKKKLSAKEQLFQRDLPHYLLEIVRKYFRLEVEGLENIKQKGRILLASNHSGVTALDSVMVGHEVFRTTERIVRVMAHPLWFVGPHIRILSKKMGLTEASKDEGERLLKKNRILLMFPEGEAGNFKPTVKRYRLREFRRGFVRMAMASQAPIVPVVVIGAEETNINLSQLKLTRYIKGIIIPLPLNVLPLPAKWKIVFLPPIDMSQYTEEDASNKELVHEICEKVRTQIQNRIDKELTRRDWIFFPKGSSRNVSTKRAIAEQTIRRRKKRKSKVSPRKASSRKSSARNTSPRKLKSAAVPKKAVPKKKRRKSG